MADFTLSDVAKMKPGDMTLEEVRSPKNSAWDAFKDGAGNLIYGTAKGLADPVYGVSQLALHGANALTRGRLQTATDNYDNLIRGGEQQYQADTAGSIAAGVGRLAGNLAMPVKGAQLLKGATVAQKLMNAGATGALIGATQPVTSSASNYWPDKALQVGVGAAAGGTLSALGTAAGGAFNAIRPLVSPKSAAGNILLNGVNGSGAGNVGALVADPAGVASRLAAVSQLVSGSKPTTAQVAGLPSLVMAEKTLKNNPAYRTAFEERSISNNDARMAALRNIAGTPEDLVSAIARREGATSPLYSSANAETHAVSPELQAILERPSAQAALARGQKLAAERGETAGVQGGAPAVPSQQVASPVLDASGAPYTSATQEVAAVAPTVGGKTLQYLKMGIDELRKERPVGNGMGSHEAAALNATRRDLDNWMAQNSPTFKTANEMYAQHSVPINTMEAGQGILSALQNGTMNASGDVAPQLSQFRTQYAKALNASPYGIHPEAKQTLDAIQSDLQRETVSNSIRSSGSDTAFNLQAPNWLSGKLFGEGLDGKSMLGRGLGAVGGFMSGGPMGAAGGVVAAQKLGSIAGNRVNTQLQEAMLDPAYFAKLLREASARQAQSGAGLLSAAPVKAGAVGSDEALGLLSGN